MSCDAAHQRGATEIDPPMERTGKHDVCLRSDHIREQLEQREQKGKNAREDKNTRANEMKQVSRQPEMPSLISVSSDF